MPRSFSGPMIQAMMSQECGEAVLVLLTIDHADLLTPLRVTSDAVETVSSGHSYVAYPFEIVLPSEPEDTAVSVSRVRISNVDQEIGDALRALQSPAEFTIALVRGAAPDTIEAAWPYFKLREVKYDGLFVSGDLSLDDFSTEPCPAHSYTPSTAPAIF